MTILEKIKENAFSHPSKTAITEAASSGEYNSLTWEELDSFSDKLALYIYKTQKDKKPIIVYGHKNPYMVVCFLACVKAGKAYCPVDINVPVARVEKIINSVDPEIIFCTEELNINNCNIRSLENIKSIIKDTEDVIPKDCYVNKEDVFYIIFTSGSTGNPKGVQITRDCLDNFIKWAATLGSGCSSNTHYTFINQAPFSFDLSVMDLYLSLYTGGTLWCLTKELQTDMKELYKSLAASGGGKWISTPSFADICLSDPLFSQELMPCLTDFLFCGEVLTNKTADRLRERFPKAHVVNTYGPTESTCAVTSLDITVEVSSCYNPLPVGRTKPGTWIEIWDDNDNPLDEGQQGEIVIIGDSVSAGYWDNDELNSRSFGMRRIGSCDYRYYRTGDAGFFSEDLLFYCGRIDLQVKLHGYRIEIEDIESNLLKIPGVTQAVVIPKYRDGKVSSLVAGVVISEPISDEKESVKNIKTQLRTNLPDYMIPKKIKFLSAIPMTNNGKADRKAAGELL